MSLVVVIIVLALIFDYINGFHDAANSIATVVSTKVLTPFQAVLWAAVFNFAAFFLFKDHSVANTVSKTVVDTFITLDVILAGLIAAIIWNLLTWWYGIPSSSSHTLIGGFAGAAVMHAIMVKGWMPIGDIVASDKIIKVVLFIFLAPIIGMIISTYITLVTIKRNIWGRLSLILVSSLAVFFLFSYFMDVRLESNLAKFYRIEKYKKQFKFHPEINQNKENLDLALEHYNESKSYLADYKLLGGKAVAKQIVSHVDLTDILINKQREKVERFLRYDQIKKEAFFDSSKKSQLEAVNLLIARCQSDFENYYTIGSEKTALSIASKINLSKVQREKFVAGYNFNIEDLLHKDLSKADNRPLTYIMMAMFAMFSLVYVYVEKIKKPTAAKMANMFKKLQLISSAAFSLGHGGSDAQKVMGIIGAALIANGNIVEFKELPNWVPLACYSAIALGTLSGGWKIVKTMGTKITKVTPLEGVGAETAGAITLFMTAQMGIPVSTTHTITGAIIGVGATKRLSAVRWGVTRNLLFAWIVTIPISAIVAGLMYLIISSL
ncbi:MAG: inorganic phosphate transporter [Bacteroidia bacterium]